MMKHLLWFVLPFLIGSAHAQIVAKGNAGCAGNFSANQTCNSSPAGVPIAAGDTVILVRSSLNNGVINNNCGLTFSTVIQSVAAAGRTVYLTEAPVSAACNLTVSTTSTTSFGALFVFQVFSGVASIGHSATQAQTGGTVTNCSVSLGQPVAATGNFVVGGYEFGTDKSAGIAASAWQAYGAGTVAMQYALGTTLTPATAQITNSAGPCGRVIAELVAGSGVAGPLVATVGDAMRTIVLAHAGNKDYELPNATLSNTWCTWLMPSGANSNTYAITVASGAEVNGQTNPINVPSWQMSRICQDDSGHYWANAPLKAGSGITITPSPTGTIISTGAGAAVSKIAGGTVTLGNGTTAIAADTCQSLAVVGSLAAVVQTDVVSWSEQPLPGNGWGNGKMVIRPQAGTGSIDFEVCNTGTSSYTPAAHSVNWQVIR